MTGGAGTEARHVLVIGAGRDVPDRIRELAPDVTTSVLCRASLLARVPSATRNRYLVSLADGSPVANWVEAAGWIHRTLPVTNVFCFGEKDQDKWAAVGEALGLDAPSPDTARWVNDKLAMRERLRETGVDDAPAIAATDPEAVLAFAGRVGYPLVCKPIGGTASRGVSRIDGPADVLRALAWAADGTVGLDETGLLVEPFRTGREYSVEAVSQHGEHLVLAVTEKHKEPRHYVEVGHLVPAPIDDGLRARIVGTVVDALTALGIRSAVTHTEVIVDDARVYVVETHLRPGGDDIGNLVHATTGVNPSDLLARLALGLPVLSTVKEQMAGHDGAPYAAVWFASSPGSGELVAVDGVDRARGLPGVAEVRIVAEPGSRVRELRHSLDRIGYVRAVGDSPAQALGRARAAVGALAVTVRATGADLTGAEESGVAESSEQPAGSSAGSSAWPELLRDVAMVRAARPTTNLAPLDAYYRDRVGLAEQASFRDHDGYDGVIFRLGDGRVQWEMTQGPPSDEVPDRRGGWSLLLGDEDGTIGADPDGFACRSSGAGPVRFARRTARLEACAAFYGEVLGLPVRRTADAVLVLLPDETCQLRLDVVSDEPPPPTVEDLLVLYFATEESREPAIAALRAAGAPVGRPHNPWWSTRAVCFADPDGYLLALSSLA